MLKNFFIRLARRLRPSNLYLIGWRNRVRCACNAKRTLIVIRGGTGNEVVVDDSATTFKLEVLVRGHNNRLVVGPRSYLRGRIELYGDGNTITIGSDSVIGGGLLMAHHGTTISIGDGCLLAGEVNIRTSDSHSILSADGTRLNPDKNIAIGNRVWFGCDVTVLKGSVIGSDVVVGALTLVCKAVPDRTVVAGMPARVIRENTTWCQ